MRSGASPWCGLLLALCTSAVRADDWRYVVPDAGAAMEHPPFHPAALSRERPADLGENVAYRGKTRLYAQLRYGAPNSTRVAIVVDELADGGFDVYVDQDRNRQIDADDLVAGSGAVRRVSIAAQFVAKDAVTGLPRMIALRRSSLGKSIGVATLGYLEGEAELNGKRVMVRRVDGDGNGVFADLRDRLWIDRDGDGRFDPITEQLPYLPVLRLDERRFAVRADAVGQRLSFEEIVGTGRIKLHLPSLAATARLQDLQVMLVGEDGAALTLQQSSQPHLLPVGRYALATVSLSVVDAAGGEPWNFVFSRSGADAPRRWYEIGRDQEVSVDPIGSMRFDARLTGAVQPGRDVQVTPVLYSGDGLLLNSSTRGDADNRGVSENYNCATLRLSASGAVVDTQQSGFA
jgi:hypothetical protein